MEMTGATAPDTAGAHAALCSESHQRSVLRRFADLRSRGLLCDITLAVGDARFPAHKVLLAASSDYFSSVFASASAPPEGPEPGTTGRFTSTSTYTLEGVVASGTFTTVLEFIYGARVSVERGSAESGLLMEAARLLEIADLVRALSGPGQARRTGTEDGEVVNEAGAEDREVGAGTEDGEVSNDAGTEDRKVVYVDDADSGGVSKIRPKRKRGRPRRVVNVPATGCLPASQQQHQQGGSQSRITEQRAVPRHMGDEGQGVMDDDGDDPANSVSANTDPVELTPGRHRHPDSDDADYEPRAAERSRHSKRKVRPPIKYVGYSRVSAGICGDGGPAPLHPPAGAREPGRPGRKRKYPDTEARCEDCGKVFKNHVFLKIHMRTHTGQKSFSCDKCGKTFTQRRQLKCHYQVHTGKLLPECELCHHRFMDTAQLKKHLRTHTGEKPFTCEICGKCFTAKSTLQTHIRIHRARRRHVASHSGKQPFTCDFCSASFNRPDNLKTHVKTHTKEQVATGTTSGGSVSSSEAPVAVTAGEQMTTSAGPEEVRDILQLQQYRLPPGGPEQREVRLVVTAAEVDELNFVGGQAQEISIIAAPAAPGPSPCRAGELQRQPPSSAHLHNLTLVSAGGCQGGAVDHGQHQHPHIQTLGVLGGQIQASGQPEHMHVITLSKEAMEHLQSHHIPVPPPPPPARQQQQQHTQAIHVNSQSNQPISISQTSQQLSSHHIQGQTFQIQAGTVSYLYTTNTSSSSSNSSSSLPQS
ncbi:hypothetical protein CRUP_023818 [Coryphaenoides rupestris]|nr:hypothetical protein CRUP_023818 [Coryphaenoides rupestris]